MSDAIRALEADRAELLGICRALDPTGWKMETGCPGWSVKDLVAHMGALFWAVVDPAALPDATGLPTEAAQEVYVDWRRAMTAADVLEDYEAVSDKAIAVLAGFADADFEIPLGDLGTYTARVLPTAFCFDHYTHIRADLFAPRGPLAGPAPASDELRLVPTLDWIAAALPQQNQAIVDRLAGPVEVVIEGTAGRTIRLGAHDGPTVASVRSNADGCVRWISQRGSWEDLDVQTDGDAQILADLRPLKVF